MFSSFFLKNAVSIHNKITVMKVPYTWHYLAQYNSLEEQLQNASDEEDTGRKRKLPIWFSKAITRNQSIQIQNICREIVFNPSCNTPFPEFLSND